jgi:glycosyltransferase involved in cell wall biosynthesis
VSQASAVLCVSSDLANWAGKYGARGNVHTIQNGIDASVFRFRPQSLAGHGLGVPADERVVLFVGWLSEQKGVPQLLDAIAILNQRDGGRWHAALIGEGYMEADLRRQARDLHIAENIRFLGPLQPEQIAAWMAAADLFCLPSETEGCPNVILEALSCGCPVVATSVGGAPELVDEDCAILIAERKPDVLARALENAAQRTWDRGQIAGKHQRSWHQVARETYAVCEQAVDARRKMETGGVIEVGHGD